MSKSKRAIQEQAKTEPRAKKRLFIDAKGAIRTGWLLAASLLAYALSALLTRYALVRAFRALFGAWGIDAASASRAPGWARALYIWHGSLATLAFALLTLALCRWLAALWRLPREPLALKGTARAALLGALGALAVAALCLLPDSSRPAWPLTSPHWSGSLVLLCALSLLSVWAEETFSKGLLLKGLLGRWRRPWAELFVCALFFLMDGGLGGSWIGAVNVLLLGGFGCLLYERRGLGAAVLFRWGWSAVNAFLLGFGGGGASVYRLYGLSETLLTGGDAGPAHGLWTTLLFAGGIACVALYRPKGPTREA